MMAAVAYLAALSSMIQHTADALAVALVGCRASGGLAVNPLVAASANGPNGGGQLGGLVGGGGGLAGWQGGLARGWRAGRLVGRRAGGLAGWRAGGPAGRRAGRLAGWRAGGPAGRWAGGLAGWRVHNRLLG